MDDALTAPEAERVEREVETFRAALRSGDLDRPRPFSTRAGRRPTRSRDLQLAWADAFLNLFEFVDRRDPAWTTARVADGRRRNRPKDW